MRISDWSSDVCSSDLQHHPGAAPAPLGGDAHRDRQQRQDGDRGRLHQAAVQLALHDRARHRTVPGPHPMAQLAEGHLAFVAAARPERSEEHTSELQSLMRTSYAVFCLKKTTTKIQTTNDAQTLRTHHITHTTT